MPYKPVDIVAGLLVAAGMFWYFSPRDAATDGVASPAATSGAASPEVSPTPASAPSIFAHVRYAQGDDPAIRLVETDAENPVFVYVRDMRPDVRGFVLCPDPDVMLRARGPVMAADGPALEDALSGQGCFVATDGWGQVIAVHVQSFAQVRWTWLAGADFDTMVPVRLESSGREYWAFSTQLGTMGTNDRVEPLIDAGFR